LREQETMLTALGSVPEVVASSKQGLLDKLAEIGQAP
jgi:hypothetical protein